MAPERKYINDSLLITPELCRYYKACVQGLEYMDKFHPQGFTVDDVYNHRVRHIPVYFMSWGYHFLPFTDKDREKFLEFAQITDCARYYLVFKCKNCSDIDNSINCESSKSVSNSQNVISSYTVRDSKFIQESRYICDSEEIDNCCVAIKCNRAVGSKYIYNSEDITDCYAVSDCKDLRDCLFLEGVETADKCILSKGSNIKNRIFCTEDCPPYEYALLNKKISKTRFDSLFKDISEILLDEPLSENAADFMNKPKAMKLLFAESFSKILPRLKEILSSLTEEDKLLLFKLSLCLEFLR